MRTALVTGASRGIGRAIASELAAAGWSILAPARAELDLSAPESVDRYCAGLEAAASVDALINNAGINIVNPVTTLCEADWAAMLQVNVTAPCRLVQAVVGGMVTRRWAAS